MSRKSRRNAPIKVLTSADRELLRALGNVGSVSSAQAHRYCGVNADRLQRLERSGLVERSPSVVNGKTVEVVTLTRKGQEITKTQLGLTHLYVRNGRQVGHDLKLAECYFSLPERVRNTWKNGSQVEADQGHRRSHADHRSLVDAVVQQDGELIAIEVVTRSYGQREIAEKAFYAAEVLRAGIRFI